MRRVLPVVLAMLVALAVGGRTSSANTGYVHFYVHMNAYDHRGNYQGCTNLSGGTATWESSWGRCHGAMEEGKFLSHHFAHSSAVSWTWDGSSLSVNGPGFSLHGTKPHNWYTFTVTKAVIDGVTYHSAVHHGVPAGHPGGPLYVTLTSKRFFKPQDSRGREGQVLDLNGYLARS
jgi:hypothetical protein